MNRRITTTFAAVLVLAAVIGSNAARGAGIHLDKPYDWTVEVKTNPLPHHFEYHESHVHGIERLHVTYQHTVTDDYPEPEKVKYEEIWYHKGKPLGLERKHKFEVSKGDGVSLLVTHKESSATNEECKAAANAIMRLILDANVNKNAVVNVRVQPDSFDRIRAALEELGCTSDIAGADEHTLATAINIFLQTEPDADQTQILYYM